MNKLKDYQITTIQEIRQCGDAFNDWTDEAIASFYSDWSELVFAAGWICSGAKMFYDYATNRPIDLRKEWKDIK